MFWIKPIKNSKSKRQLSQIKGLPFIQEPNDQKAYLLGICSHSFLWEKNIFNQPPKGRIESLIISQETDPPGFQSEDGEAKPKR